MGEDALAGESKTYAKGVKEAVLEYKPNDVERPYLVVYWTGEQIIDECRFKDREVAVGSCNAWINLVEGECHVDFDEEHGKQ